jgi:hypothetical protein
VKGTPDRTHPALVAAMAALKLDRRRPTDDDRPPLRTFLGPKDKPLPGQLRLEGIDDES